MNTRIGAVVVSFKPSAEILSNVIVLLSQAQEVIVVDNTPADIAIDVLDEIASLDGCTLIRNGENLGIAAALNIGIEQAIAANCEWIATFDQDSQAGDGFCAAMLSGYAQAFDQLQIGMLCPRYRDVRLGIVFPPPKENNGNVIMCMTSGAMMKAETFTRMGPMEEPLFIDYVDYEYCMRMRAVGLRVLECPDAILLHSLGRMTERSILGRKMLMTNHSAHRRYYINRNRLVLIRRYIRKFPGWSFHEFKGLIMDTVKVLLLEGDRLRKAEYSLLAIYDGMLGRLGPRVTL